ncbi:hypothetical protein AVEN_255730-1 [Araneus ventricosus]|uniref:Uncharacterized protein n=1 Tax=Araneus ventricosus TaxID=182803 RepID=A0A4Y2VE61_ARAVE|nr:hypothetical protein AVEN_255730-1 [Araneus ventricosus]
MPRFKDKYTVKTGVPVQLSHLLYEQKCASAEISKNTGQHPKEASRKWCAMTRKPRTAELIRQPNIYRDTLYPGAAPAISHASTFYQDGASCHYGNIIRESLIQHSQLGG